MNLKVVSTAVAASTLICGLPAFAQGFEPTENTEVKKVTAILNTFQLLDELEPGQCSVDFGNEIVRLSLADGDVTTATASTSIEVISPSASIIALGVTPPRTSSGLGIPNLTSSATIEGLATGKKDESRAIIKAAENAADDGFGDSKLGDKTLKATATSSADLPDSAYALSQVMEGSVEKNQVDAGLISTIGKESTIEFELEGINVQDLQSDALAGSENIMFDAYVVCEPVVDPLRGSITPVPEIP